MTTPRLMIRAVALMCCVSIFMAGALLCETQLVPLYVGMAGVALTALIKILGAINGVYPPRQGGDSGDPSRTIPPGPGSPRGDETGRRGLWEDERRSG